MSIANRNCHNRQNPSAGDTRRSDINCESSQAKINSCSGNDKNNQPYSADKPDCVFELVAEFRHYIVYRVPYQHDI